MLAVRGADGGRMQERRPTLGASRVAVVTAGAAVLALAVIGAASAAKRKTPVVEANSATLQG